LPISQHYEGLSYAARGNRKEIMHITCPSCSATFKAEAERFRGGARRVRCGRCGHVWREAPAAQPTAEETFPPDPQAAPPRQRSGHPGAGPPQGGRHEPYPQRPPRRGGSGLGWILFVVVIGALVVAAWYFRNEIVAEVPETAEIYRKLNIPLETKAEGLEISGVTSVRRTVGGERRLVVSGSVVNVSQAARDVPMLRAVVSDSDGKEVMSWEFAAARRRLDPGSVATFETSTANPPAESTLKVEFAGAR
jgi:predicted Zn finger-like uncharacterized protein